MNGYEYDLEDEDIVDGLEFDEGYESDESDESDELDGNRGGRRGHRRPGRIRLGRTSTGRGLTRPRAPTSRYVTQPQFEAAMARVGRQIQTNSEAIKKVTAQANRITADLTTATNRLDKQVGEVKKEVKKQSETTLLLTLLNKAPAIKTEKVTLTPTGGAPVDVITKVEQEKQSNVLPLVLLAGSGGLGGGDSSNLLLLALALSGSL